MKKVIYPFVILLLASCGSDKIASLPADAPREPSSTKITVQSILSNMEKASFREGELIVKFKSGIVTPSSAKVHQAMGASVVRRYSSVSNLEHVKLPTGVSVKDAVVRYMSDPNVEYAEPNYIRRKSAFVPNDLFFGQQWALRNTGTFAGGTAGADIKAPEAWDITRGTGNIVIAVLDTGIDLNHADLVWNIWKNPFEDPNNAIDDDGNGRIDDWRGWNFVNNTNSPLDDDGHGTHVSGIIGAVGNNGMGTAGMIWSVQLMAMKFIGQHADGYYGLVTDELAAIDYVITMKNKGINVRAINASFGGKDFSLAEKDAIVSANNASILFVAAAGNGGDDGIGDNNDLVPTYPASYGLSNIISVAATDQNDKRATFSDFGPNSVHLAAPGNFILSTIPTSIFPSGYEFLSGTSMAAPHVTGLTGLLYTYYTDFTLAQVRATILRYVDALPSLTGWLQTNGRINAYRALSSLLTPTNLAATADSSSKISLTWSGNATGEDGYKIERKTGAGSFGQITTVPRLSRPDAIPMPPVTYSFANTGLTDGTRYTYRVRAFNTIPADSFFSNEASAVTPLNPPTNLVATGISTSQMSLTWTDNSQTEEGYVIERKEGSVFVQRGTVGPNATAFTDSGLSSNTSFTYRVKAFNTAAGSSLYSNEATGKTLAEPGQSTGGGGGCSIGARQNTPTAAADLAVLLMPLLLTAILRRKRR